MKKRYIIITIIILVVLIPTMIFAQAAPSNDTTVAINFLQGKGTFGDWFMEIFTQFDNSIDDKATMAAYLGRAIGGLGALIYLSYMGWQMQAGDREWEITPMIKPLIIALILFHWTGFTSLIEYPLSKLAIPSQEIFATLEEDAEEQRTIRFEKQNELVQYVIEQKSEADASESLMDFLKGEKSFDDLWDEGMDKLFAPVIEWKYKMEFQMQRLVADLIEAISLSILRICTYLIFFIQKIWMYILMVLGPIAVGMTLIPGFESSLTNWIAKFININLYTFIAYTIVDIGQQLIIAGYKMEINRYDFLLGTNAGQINQAAILQYLSMNGMIQTVMFPCVAFLVTAIGILMTPTIADSIVSAGGAGVMTKAKGGARGIYNAGKSTAQTAAKIGSML